MPLPTRRITYRHNDRAGRLTLRRVSVLTPIEQTAIDDIMATRYSRTDIMRHRIVGDRCAIDVVRDLDGTYAVLVARYSQLQSGWVWSSRFQAISRLSLRGAYQRVNAAFAHYARMGAPVQPPPPRITSVPSLRNPGRRCSACGAATVEPATQCASCIEAGRADNGEL